MNKHNIRPKLTYEAMDAILRQWADECKDDIEMQYLSISFDDFADQIFNAHKWATEPRDETPDDSWIARQDAAIAAAGATA